MIVWISTQHLRDAFPLYNVCANNTRLTSTPWSLIQYAINHITIWSYTFILEDGSSENYVHGKSQEFHHSLCQNPCSNNVDMQSCTTTSWIVTGVNLINIRSGVHGWQGVIGEFFGKPKASTTEWKLKQYMSEDVILRVPFEDPNDKI